MPNKRAVPARDQMGGPPKRGFLPAVVPEKKLKLSMSQVMSRPARADKHMKLFRTQMAYQISNKKVSTFGCSPRNPENLLASFKQEVAQAEVDPRLIKTDNISLRKKLAPVHKNYPDVPRFPVISGAIPPDEDNPGPAIVLVREDLQAKEKKRRGLKPGRPWQEIKRDYVKKAEEKFGKYFGYLARCEEKICI